MSLYGFSPSVVDWFRAFLWQRTQSVRVGDRCSSWLPVDKGVAQGPPLRPFVFQYMYVYINDLPAVIQHRKYHLYADDLHIYKQFSLSTIFDAVQSINSDISAIAGWATANGLKLNPKKINLMLLGNRRHLDKAQRNTIDPI